LVLAVAPLPFASNRAWAWTLLALLVGVLCATWPLARRGDADLLPIPVSYFAVPGVLFGMALLWGFVQTLSTMPEALQHPIWSQTARALGQSVEGRIGLDPLAAESRLMRLVAYAGIFWLAAQHAASGRRARALVDACAVFGAVYAAYGLALFLSDSETILGYEKWAYRDSLTSTFVNRNHFATFAGICAICAASALAQRLGGGSSAWVRITQGDALVYAVAVAILLVATVATASRAGVASVAIGFAAWFVARADVALVRRAAALAIVATGVAGALFVVFDWRDESTLVGDVSMRLHVYEISVAAIETRPWLGYGFGSFPAVFAALRTPGIAQVWNEAHNVYLELAIELGVPAGLAFLASLFWIVVICARARASSAACVALAAAATIAVHSTVDFSVQMPAVAALWAALLGAGYGRAWMHR
jgi:O-antigen ligase